MELKSPDKTPSTRAREEKKITLNFPPRETPYGREIPSKFCNEWKAPHAKKSGNLIRGENSIPGK